MTDNVSKIKDRLDVVDVISGYIKVQKAGVNFKACCPFHNEKTPSFYISPERQIWHCFGCSKGGDMFSFVKEIEGIEFPEALRILAQRAGIEIDQFDPAVRNEKNRLYSLMETAVRFFEKQLHESSYGRKALDYLLNRGLTMDTIKEFRLGYAPNDWYSLSKFLDNCGYSKKEIVEAGLALNKEGRSDIYDRFRSRIAFPIFDLNSQPVGFTGRIFNFVENSTGSQPSTSNSQQPSAEPAKYINTPQTQIYDKSHILYGLNKAKTEIKTNNRCVLVEGNMDMLMSHQAGVRNVIASSGTALTPSHLRLLNRYTNNLSFCFDTDQAGAIATKRGIGLALSQNFNINVISIDDKECKDPADYVQKYSSKWNETVSRAKPIIDYYFDKVRRECNPTLTDGRKHAILSLAPFIKRLASQVEKSHWMAQLAFFLRVEPNAVKADIESAKDELDQYERYGSDAGLPGVVSIVSKNSPQIMDSDIYNESLLSVIIKNPSLFKEDLKNLPSEVSPFVREIVLKMAKDQEFSLDNYIKTLDPDKSLQLEFAYLRSQELWKDFSDEALKEEFHNLTAKIKQRAIVVQLASIEFDIREAEAANDKTRVDELMAKFGLLTQELSQSQEI